MNSALLISGLVVRALIGFFIGKFKSRKENFSTKFKSTEKEIIINQQLTEKNIKLQKGLQHQNLFFSLFQLKLHLELLLERILTYLFLHRIKKLYLLVPVLY